MKIALFGGSFDPPHLAHVQVVQYLLDSKRYDQVWVIPTKQNPLKSQSEGFEQRLEMCRLAFGDLDDRVQVREDDKLLSGFTIDLIHHLQKENPKAKFTLVVGSELREEIPEWKDGKKLLQSMDFEYLPRPPAAGSPFLPLSSTEVRRKLFSGEVDPRRLIPEKVAQYVEKGQLYGT